MHHHEGLPMNIPTVAGSDIGRRVTHLLPDGTRRVYEWDGSKWEPQSGQETDITAAFTVSQTSEYTEREHGSRDVYRQLLNIALVGLRREEAPDSLDGLRARVAQLEAIRADTVATLRSVCAEFGDNDWPDNMSPSDIIQKHLAEYFERDDE
jgi:hypothetical protein